MWAFEIVDPTHELAAPRFLSILSAELSLILDPNEVDTCSTFFGTALIYYLVIATISLVAGAYFLIKTVDMEALNVYHDLGGDVHVPDHD